MIYKIIVILLSISIISIICNAKDILLQNDVEKLSINLKESQIGKLENNKILYEFMTRWQAVTFENFLLNEAEFIQSIEFQDALKESASLCFKDYDSNHLNENLLHSNKQENCLELTVPSNFLKYIRCKNIHSELSCNITPLSFNQIHIQLSIQNADPNVKSNENSSIRSNNEKSIISKSISIQKCFGCIENCKCPIIQVNILNTTIDFEMNSNSYSEQWRQSLNLNLHQDVTFGNNSNPDIGNLNILFILLNIFSGPLAQILIRFGIIIVVVLVFLCFFCIICVFITCIFIIVGFGTAFVVGGSLFASYKLKKKAQKDRGTPFLKDFKNQQELNQSKYEYTPYNPSNNTYENIRASNPYFEPPPFMQTEGNNYYPTGNNEFH